MNSRSLSSDSLKYLLVFGERIRLARIRRGWRGTELAERAGVSRNTVSALERGHPAWVFGVIGFATLFCYCASCKRSLGRALNRKFKEALGFCYFALIASVVCLWFVSKYRDFEEQNAQREGLTLVHQQEPPSLSASYKIKYFPAA